MPSNANAGESSPPIPLYLAVMVTCCSWQPLCGALSQAGSPHRPGCGMLGPAAAQSQGDCSTWLRPCTTTHTDTDAERAADARAASQSVWAQTASWLARPPPALGAPTRQSAPQRPRGPIPTWWPSPGAWQTSSTRSWSCPGRAGWARAPSQPSWPSPSRARAERCAPRRDKRLCWFLWLAGKETTCVRPKHALAVCMLPPPAAGPHAPLTGCKAFSLLHMGMHHTPSNRASYQPHAAHALTLWAAPMSP